MPLPTSSTSCPTNKLLGIYHLSTFQHIACREQREGEIFLPNSYHIGIRCTCYQIYPSLLPLLKYTKETSTGISLYKNGYSPPSSPSIALYIRVTGWREQKSTIHLLHFSTTQKRRLPIPQNKLALSCLHTGLFVFLHLFYYRLTFVRRLFHEGQTNGLPR